MMSNEEFEARQQAVREAKEREVRLGQLLLSIAAKALVGDPASGQPPLNPGRLSGPDVARLADTGSRLVRLGLDQSTDNQAIAVRGQLLVPEMQTERQLFDMLEDVPGLAEVNYVVMSLYSLGQNPEADKRGQLALAASSLREALDKVGELFLAAVEAEPLSPDDWSIRKGLEAIGRADAWQPVVRPPAALPEPEGGHEQADDHKDDQPGLAQDQIEENEIASIYPPPTSTETDAEAIRRRFAQLGSGTSWTGFVPWSMTGTRVESPGQRRG